ncbi:hypothetical protein F5Y14DRAFT_252039 [Nemania sp. NC0429]|nr:hypothetical protein F5Y14DRAFT_252039 [Nemania sp. NC0429]
MRVSACLQSAIAVTLGASLVTARVIGENGSPVNTAIMKRDLSVRSTGRDGPACAGHLCARGPVANMAKRQDRDDCTEEKLLQCTIWDEKAPQVCFQQLCL